MSQQDRLSVILPNKRDILVEELRKLWRQYNSVAKRKWSDNSASVKAWVKSVSAFFRPRWVTCVAFAAAVILISVCAVCVGLVMGYTYSYLEYRSALRSVNASEATDIIHIMQLSQPDLSDPANKTFSAALMSNALVSRILTLGHSLMQEKANYLPWLKHDDHDSSS